MCEKNTLESEIKNLIARQIEKQTLSLNEQLASLQAEFREMKNQNLQRNEEQIGIFNRGFLDDPRAEKETSFGVDKSQKNKFDEEQKNISQDNDHQSYAEGLTIHGLSRIATGGPGARVIWSLLIITSFIIAIIISKEHWDAFLDHDSQTSTKVVTQEEMALPAITICTFEELNVHRRRFIEGKPVLTRPQLIKSSAVECARNLTECGYNGTTLLKVQSASSDYEHLQLRNRFVEFDNTTNCFTVRGKIQTTPSHVLSVRMIAERKINVNEWTEIYVNHPIETFFQASAAIYWASEGFYHVIIEKKIIKRLGLPYTDCVEGSGTYEQNKFTGNYTVHKCFKGCFFEAVFKRCGAIPLMYKKHLSKPEMFENKTEINETLASSCLYDVEEDDDLIAKCNVQCHIDPCYEEEFKITPLQSPIKTDNRLELAFTYKSFLMEIVQEIPSYTWQDLFANFGGCVGLMTGASILSIFELLIFSSILITNLFSKATKKAPSEDKY